MYVNSSYPEYVSLEYYVDYTAVNTTEADEAIASEFSQNHGYFPNKQEPTRVILISFDYFTSSDFNIWLRSWIVIFFNRCALGEIINFLVEGIR